MAAVTGESETKGRFEAASRYRTAAYWWVVTELVRRNPQLELIETYPMDGFYDCLTVHGDSAGRAVHIDFNRLGRVHVHPDHIGLIDDHSMLSRESAHSAVKQIEQVAGLSPSDSAPSSNGRIITLRMIARVLNSVVNDRVAWDARMLTPHGYGWSLPMLPEDDRFSHASPKTPGGAFATLFPKQTELEAFFVASAIPEGFTPGRFWCLLRDETPVAVFDTAGYLQTRTSRVAVKSLYARMNRNLTLTVAHALGEVLP